ncbi:MAG: 6-bladed beta-propeller [Gemmatimonadetes bacterium]|nr:6-bladed beta-propeller [Gemmatimonadota bacterium]MYE92468.1 6-bladed beta-propeller [Gemmatimonadota bacterium]MYJ10484.1 6-bladed beta-propeller [Gemmatimonadota bacterium]
MSANVCRGVTSGIVASLAYLSAACGSAPDAPPIEKPEVDTIGGVVVVRNGPTGLWREGEQWQVVEEFRVGSVRDGADEAVTAPRNNSVTLGPNGQIFVLEYRAARVLVFSEDGEFVRSFGGSGEGPGEFRGPHALAWDGVDRLWVADGLNGRYHVFDSTGTFQWSVPRPVRAVNRIQHPLVVDGVGTLIDESATARGLPMVLFVRVDTMGHVVDTMAVLPKPELSGGFRNVIVRPSQESLRFIGNHYIPRLRWSLAPDGTVWSASTGRLRLVQTDSSGDTIRIVETSHRESTFDRADRKAIADGLAEGGISRQDVELVRPLVNELYVMDDGHILVGIIEEVGEDPSLVDVFSPDGHFLGSVDLGFGLPRRNVPALVGDTIVAVTPGLLDVPFLVRATIVRP